MFVKRYFPPQIGRVVSTLIFLDDRRVIAVMSRGRWAMSFVSVVPDIVAQAGRRIGEPWLDTKRGQCGGGGPHDRGGGPGQAADEVSAAIATLLGTHAQEFQALVEVYSAHERARRGDRDEAIPLMRAAVDHLVRQGQLLQWGIPATGVLVQTLLDRGADGDMAEAEAAIERLAAARTDDGLAIRQVMLLRLHALVARAHGDAAAYAHFRDRYRDMARTLGFEGHTAWAETMP
jgi:PE family